MMFCQFNQSFGKLPGILKRDKILWAFCYVSIHLSWYNVAGHILSVMTHTVYSVDWRPSQCI